jgi:hypothetical protein
MMRGQPFLAGLRDLSPGYFALVMATGIVSRAAYLDGFSFLAAVLLAVAAAAYVVLVAAYGWRQPASSRADLAGAHRVRAGPAASLSPPQDLPGLVRLSLVLHCATAFCTASEGAGQCV